MKVASLAASLRYPLKLEIEASHSLCFIFSEQYAARYFLNFINYLIYIPTVIAISNPLAT